MSEPHSEEPSFEDSLLQLERTVRELEDGQLSLEDALARYEEGVGLIKHCYARLRAAEMRILELTGTNEAGEAVLRTFKHEATNSAAPRRAVRGRVDEIE